MQRKSSRRRAPQAPAAGGSDDPLARAVGLLARRAHSKWELRRKLRQKGFDSDTVEVTLARLVELGYLDDQAFASGLVRRRGALRGPLVLSAELAGKGVSRAEAEVALAEFDAEAQLLSATRLAERLYARRRGLGYRETLDGVGVKLLRRGFSATIVRAVCRSVVADAAQPHDD